MEREEPRAKDLSDPTYDMTDFCSQLAGGSLRWLALVLAVASLGLLIWFLTDKDEPEIHFPFHLKGKSVLWVVAAAAGVWLVIAGVNWWNWRRKQKGLP